MAAACKVNVLCELRTKTVPADSHRSRTAVFSLLLSLSWSFPRIGGDEASMHSLATDNANLATGEDL